MNRRTFLKSSLAVSAAGILPATGVAAEAAPPKPVDPKATLPAGKIGSLTVSRMLLGGNLLTHFTHSRDLEYVTDLTRHYNTDAKIMETLALAEQNGINTLSMHNPPRPMSVLKKYRNAGGKIQWIICPTASTDNMENYAKHVKELVDGGCDAIYLWGVHADPLAAAGKIDQIAKAVEVAKDMGVPSGVGCHDLRVVVECEKNKVPCDFYIKTFHHHRYPSAPRPEEIRAATSEPHPAYWCRDPEQTIEVMKAVEKPWIAFKIMAAGAIPPGDAFPYAFNSGADHILVGMFDFEIEQDAAMARKAIAGAKRVRPWRN